MNNKLAQIIAHKHCEILDRKKHAPVNELIFGLQKSTRSLASALSNKQTDFILECKKASPSKGIIRDNFDHDFLQILSEYSHFASAISVLTDERFFQGSFDYLKKASEKTKCPILCKDFFIDEFQVYEARYYGADAILLMLSVLNDNQYLALRRVAEELNLDIITEVHTQNELKRALAMDAKIIGINNRNLKDLSIDLTTTEKLARQIPSSTIVISESGISNHQQIRRLAPLVNGFLIGSSIMATNDIRSQCKKLLYGNIKICGITRVEDAKEIENSGACYGGFIFYQRSARFVNLETAKTIVEQVNLRYAGVFVNEPIEDIVKTARRLKLYAIQLHGDESATDIAKLKNELPETKIWKAIKVSKQITIKEDKNVDRYLLDNFDPGTAGGSGKSFDWNYLEQKNIQNTGSSPLDIGQVFLAGGINSENILTAIKRGTYGIDLSSAVEISPGIKCQQKIQQLFKKIRV